MQREGNGDTNVTIVLGTIPKGLVRGLEEMEVRRLAETI